MFCQYSEAGTAPEISAQVDVVTAADEDVVFHIAKEDAEQNASEDDSSDDEVDNIAEAIATGKCFEYAG